ncbi:FtsK/SpoIIIE domain-containing protein [Streptomyces sp. NPDC059639]|uniref:FtsK/SpoIIIE domain-containing protein n=1 Tax=Streptomyces sp. NPDC059639 TaxID=3346891 RepID=UPI0036741B81
MGKKSQQGDDLSAQVAGGIGGLVVVFGVLGAIKEKLGLSLWATTLLTAGFMVLLGYGLWKLRASLLRLLTSQGRPSAGKATEADGKAAEALTASDEPADVPAHPELTPALRTAGVIGKDEIIRASEATVTPVRTGVEYDFLVPAGRTYADVEKRLANVAGVLGVSRQATKLERSRDTERRARLLVLNGPPFSELFAPPTRQEIEKFGGVPLGHDVVGQLAGVPTFDKASMLIAGMTQMGKTTLVNGLITCLLIAYGEFDLYLLDGKFCGLTRFRPVAKRYEASDDPEVMENMLDELNGRSDSRYAEIREAVQNRRPAPKFRPVFFIVDEAADFFANDGSTEGKNDSRRISEKARSLVSKSLESGIGVLMLTQRPEQNAIPVMVREQFLYRLCLYVASEGTAKVALGDNYFETVAPINPTLLDPSIKGQGVLFAAGTSTLIRGFNFPDEFIWGVVDEVQGRQAVAFEKAPESPRKQIIQLMRDKGGNFLSTADIATVLNVPDPRPSEAGKEVAKMLGTKSTKDESGTARGFKLSALLALEGAEA